MCREAGRERGFSWTKRKQKIVRDTLEWLLFGFDENDKFNIALQSKNDISKANDAFIQIVRHLRPFFPLSRLNSLFSIFFWWFLNELKLFVDFVSFFSFSLTCKWRTIYTEKCIFCQSNRSLVTMKSILLHFLLRFSNFCYCQLSPSRPTLNWNHINSCTEIENVELETNFTVEKYDLLWKFSSFVYFFTMRYLLVCRLERAKNILQFERIIC